MNLFFVYEINFEKMLIIFFWEFDLNIKYLKCYFFDNLIILVEKLYNLDFNLVLVMEFWVIVLEWLGMLDVVINKVENVIVMVNLVSVN